MARKWKQGIVTAFLVAAAVSLVLPGKAVAQRVSCAPHTDLTTWLDARYKEKPLGFGLIGPRALLEVFTSESGSWTVTVTDVNGRTCIVASGENWVTLPPPALDAGQLN